jgi:hypothetical protein
LDFLFPWIKLVEMSSVRNKKQQEAGLDGVKLQLGWGPRAQEEIFQVAKASLGSRDLSAVAPRKTLVP